MDLVDKINRLSPRWLGFLVFALGLVVWGNSLFNGFVWDDEEQIVNNPLVQSISNLPQIFTSSTFNGGGASPTGWFYRPIMTFFYLLNYSVWGANAFGFHLFQVLVHLFNAILVFLIFKELFSEAKISKPKITSFLAALIFVVHPANVEAVVYIAALQESLYTFFTLLVLLLYMKAKKFEGKEIQFFFLSALLTLLVFLSKESGIFVIPFVFIFLFLFQRKRIILWLSICALTISIYLFLRLVVAKIPLSAPNVGPIANASFFERLISVPYEFFSYFRIIFFPKDLYISQHYLVANISDFRFWGFFVLAIIVSVFVLRFLLKKRSAVFFFFAFWFFGSLSLVLNLIPLDMSVAERWLYFPLIGFIGMAAVILSQLKFSKIFIKSGVFLVLVVILLFGGRTIIRNIDWHDGLTLYSRDILLNPDAFDLQNNYGVELFRAGRIEEAKGHFERSIELYPSWWFAYNNLGAVYERLEDLDKAAGYYKKALEISDYFLAYENLALVKLRINEPKETIEFLEEATAKLPNNPKLRTMLAIAYYENGQFKQAEFAARGNPSLLQAIQKKTLKWR